MASIYYLPIKPLKDEQLNWYSDDYRCGADQRHYQRVVVALKETIQKMKEIDEIIPSWPIQ